MSECPPSLSSTGTNIASTGSFCEGKSDGNSGKAAVIYTAPIQQQFSETVSKNTSSSPCFSSQNGHAVFSEDISLWKQLLTVGTNLTSSHRVFRPWFLMPSDALSSFCSASLACQSFPLRPVWQQNKQASQPQRLPTPYFQGRL